MIRVIDTNVEYAYLHFWADCSNNASGKTLKRFFRLGHVARAVFKAGEFFQEGERNFTDRTVALFCNDQFGLARFLRPRLLVFLVNFRPNE